MKNKRQDVVDDDRRSSAVEREPEHIDLVQIESQVASPSRGFPAIGGLESGRPGAADRRGASQPALSGEEVRAVVSRYGANEDGVKFAVTRYPICAKRHS